MARDPVERYYRTRYGGGRGAFARALDYVALRLILLAAAYLFYRSRFDEIWIVLSLSVLTLGLGMILMRLYRELAYARFVRRERERLRRLVLADRLMLAPNKDLKALCKTLLRPREAAALLVCAKPADANALLEAARGEPLRPLCVFSTAGFDRSANDLLARLPDVRLCDRDALLEAAGRIGITADDMDVAARVRAIDAVRRARAKRSFSFDFPKTAARRYLLAALLLFACSFATRYALYYRAFAGLCVSVAAISAALSRQKNAVPEA